MKASINWPFPQDQLQLDDPQTEEYARWCYAHFSPMAVEILRETSWIFLLKTNTWLNPSIARIFAYHVNQMQARIESAVENGAFYCEGKPSLKGNNAMVIGAAICEMLESGELRDDRFFKYHSLQERVHAKAS